MDGASAQELEHDDDLPRPTLGSAPPIGAAYCGDVATSTTQGGGAGATSSTTIALCGGNARNPQAALSLGLVWCWMLTPDPSLAR